MLILKDKKNLAAYLRNQRSRTQTIGFVPTMGALHEGHLSLLKKSMAENAVTVCSIFVNPTQFNNPEDLARYPRPVEEDIALLEKNGCPVLFLPSVEEMYPSAPTRPAESPFDLGHLAHTLEGASRPGHFQGVAQIVDVLLRTVQPDHLYIGQKDYQQCLVIQKLIREGDYPEAIALHIEPTLREPDGLAMSSRNRLLSEGQRALAGLLYQCLVSIQTKKNQAPFTIVQKECRELLEKKGLHPDYIVLADADTLEVLPDYDSERRMVALIAATTGKVRLIDNLLLQ